MTSGEFRALPVSSIIVDREGRQRRELRGIDELAASIAARGLIHPIIVTRDGNLVAGERRLTAVRSLGWTHIPVQFVDEVDPNELRAIELEENVKRVDLTWQEQCLAVAAYHEARQAMEKDWTIAKTAEALGVSESFVTRQSQVAEALRKGNTRVAEADRYSTALNIVQREAERARASKLEALDRLVEERPIERTAPLLNADFTQWIETYDGPPFNFIHCDFPYGINAPGHGQLADQVLGGYDDSPEVYDALCAALARAVERGIVSESAHLMFWFPMDYYAMTKSRLEEAGWRINPYPLIWFKSDNTGVLPDAQRGPRRVYETAFLGSLGDRKIVQAVANVVAAPATKRIHTSEKPVPVLRHFFRMLIDEYSTVLDPTCGSANALRAAEAAGAKRVLGLEKSTEFFNLAKEHYYDPL